MGLAYRDEQCPARLPGEPHSQDSAITCRFCGRLTIVRPASSEAPPKAKTPFTPKQLAALAFLRETRDRWH